MTTISPQIPDTLFRQAESIAEREVITLDEFIALALASQVSSWETGETFTQRAVEGDWQKARKILTNAPNIEPDDFDKL